MTLATKMIPWLWSLPGRLHKRTIGWVACRAGAQNGELSRRLQWPFDRWAPCHRRELHLWRAGALGDVLMCTPALRQLKRVNPDCHLTFYTKYPSLVEGLPFIDSVKTMEELPPSAIQLKYEWIIPPSRFLAQIMGDDIGVDVIEIRPSCIRNPVLYADILAKFQQLPKPWIVLSRRASAWTPNKQWPLEYWEELIKRLLAWSTVIEIGTEIDPDDHKQESTRYWDLREKLSLDELIATVSAADLLVGPISGPVHIAAAFSIPSVVIYGGYEHPGSTEYEGNINCCTPLSCSPCWLRTPCPFDRLCLRKIEPSTVEKSLKRLWQQACDKK
ncbi:MAG: glycosyltransferase family 9 protein [Schlesneria sp.]